MNSKIVFYVLTVIIFSMSSKGVMAFDDCIEQSDSVVIEIFGRELPLPKGTLLKGFGAVNPDRNGYFFGVINNNRLDECPVMRFQYGERRSIEKSLLEPVESEEINVLKSEEDMCGLKIVDYLIKSSDGLASNLTYFFNGTKYLELSGDKNHKYFKKYFTKALCKN